MAGRFSRDERAASPLASFMVALGFFSMSFATILLMVAEVGGTEAGDNLAKAGEAAGVIDLLVGTTGSPPAWSATVPDRLGLLKPGTTTTLDLVKLDSMRAWSSPGEYDDAREALGVSSRELFVRAQPVFEEGAAASALSSYRVAYVADYSGVSETLAAKDETTTLDEMSVVYRDALSDETGVGVIGDNFEDNYAFTSRQLPIKLAGFLSALDFDTGYANDGYWKVVNVDEYGAGYLDPGAGVDHVLTTSGWSGTKYEYTAYASGAASEDLLLVTMLDLRAYTGSEKVTLDFAHWASGYRLLGTVNPATDDYGYVTVRCIDTCRTGDELPATRGGYHYANGTRTSFQATSIDLSHYKGERIAVSFVWHSVLGLTAGEGWFIGPLSAKATSGTTSTIWENKLDYSTSVYDALVVGSGADQSALEDDSIGGIVKLAVRDWTKAGGHVFAMGSSAMAPGWLTPIYTANGAPVSVTGPALLAQSDLAHPILNNPTFLRPGDLVAESKAYAPSANMRSIMVAPSGSGTVPLLAASQPSTAYEGVVVTTSYLPWKLPAAQRQAFFENAFLYAEYSELYADFGAPGGVPLAGAVDAESRTVLLDASSEGLGIVECRVTAYLW